MTWLLNLKFTWLNYHFIQTIKHYEIDNYFIANSKNFVTLILKNKNS